MSISTEITKLNTNISNLKQIKQNIKNAINNDFIEITDEQIENYAQKIENVFELYKDQIPSSETEQATQITVNDAMKYSKNKIELFGNTKQDNTKIIYKCDGSETGNYYLTYNNINYYFTMPTIIEGDILIFDTIDLKLYLGDIEITTESTGAGINLIFITSPNPDYHQDIHIVNGENIINIHSSNYVTDTMISSWNTVGSVTWKKENDIITFHGNVANKNSGIYKRAAWLGENFKNLFDKYSAVTVSFEIKSDVNQQVTVFSGTKINSTTEWTRHSRTYTSSGAITFYDSSYTLKNIYIRNIKIEPGTEVTNYQPYYSKNYLINLTNIELCKIRDCQDFLFKNEPKHPNYNNNLIENAWYIHKNIQKTVLNGSEYCQYTNGIFLFSFITDYKLSTNNICICSHYLSQECVTSTSGVQDKHITFRNDSTTKRLYIKDSNITSLNDFKAWLSSNNITLYYELNVPIDTQITDENLISQLNELYENVKLNKGTNDITITAEDLEPYMKLTYKNI